jgi:hypothetical protein
MPPKSRTRKSISRDTPKIEESETTFITPRNRSATKRANTTGGPKTRQQTLTQIDFVKRPCEKLEELDLKYEELEVQSAPPAKRRKVESGSKKPSKKSQTTKRQSLRMQNLSPEVEDNFNSESSKLCIKTDSEDEVKSKQIMPPPRTPQKITERVVPSSQSPLITPMSTRSQRIVLESSVSPLRNRSVNIRNNLRSARGIRKGKPRLIVRDTFEDKENSLLSTQRTSSNIDIKQMASDMSDLEVLPKSQVSQETVQPTLKKVLLAGKLEILDSDEEPEDEDDRVLSQGDEIMLPSHIFVDDPQPGRHTNTETQSESGSSTQTVTRKSDPAGEDIMRLPISSSIRVESQNQPQLGRQVKRICHFGVE